QWFTDAVAGNEQMRKRYFFRSDDNGLASGWHRIEHDGHKMQYFGLFDRTMPDLNFDNAEVRDEVKKIAKFWLDLGIDGFRLDAAKHIYGDTFGDLSEDEIRNDNGWGHELELLVYGLNE